MESDSIHPDIIIEIMAHFGTRSELSAGDQQRFPLQNCTADFFQPGYPASEKIELIDLSRHSVGFVTSRPLRSGIKVVIALKAPGLARQVWQCQTLQSTMLAADRHYVSALVLTARSDTPVAPPSS